MNKTITPRKSLGQHFLTDPAVVGRIIAAFAPQKGEKIIEIGPGMGALSFDLARMSDDLSLLEIDSRALNYLQEQEKIRNLHYKTIQADVLDLDFAGFGTNNLRLIGNLPYNISSPILLHCLKNRQFIRDCVFMLQKEVAQRICASPQSKDYGRLSIVLGQFFSADYLFTVPPQAFSPPPKVDSGVIYLRRREQSAWQVENQEIFAELLRLAFSQRRKMLRKSLAKYLSTADFLNLNIAATARPEELSGADFAAIANWIACRLQK